MSWRIFAGTSTTMALALLASLGSAAAQQAAPAAAPPKPLKDQLVGSWTLLLVDNVKGDNTQSGAFGPNPIGSVIFAPDGHYSLQIMRSVPPANVLTEFGTYAANDADKSLTLRAEDSSNPSLDAKPQKTQVTAITNEVLTWSGPPPAGAPAGTVKMDLAWKKAK